RGPGSLDGRDQRDRATAPAQHARRGLNGRERAGHVAVQHRPPGLDGHPGQPGDGLDPGPGPHRDQPAEPLDGELDETLHRLPVGDVGLRGHRPPTRRGDLLDHRGGPLGAGAVVHHDRGARLGEPPRHARADAPARARDQGDGSVQGGETAAHATNVATVAATASSVSSTAQNSARDRVTTRPVRWWWTSHTAWPSSPVATRWAPSSGLTTSARAAAPPNPAVATACSGSPRTTPRSSP